MRNIYVIGECAMDYIKNEGAGDKTYRKVPGGCAVNVAAELGKLIKAQGRQDIVPYIAARVGDDSYGREIASTLKKAGADVSYLVTDEASTTIVYMDIDARGQRSCAGRCSGADVNLCEADVIGIGFKPGDALCFTSGGFLSGSSRRAHEYAIQKAAAAGAMICFDINIREGLWTEKDAVDILLPYVRLADIIQVKSHELRMLFGKADIGPLMDVAKGKVWAAHTDGFIERHYKRETAGGEVTGEVRLPERFYREVGMGDELFANLVLKAVGGAEPA